MKLLRYVFGFGVLLILTLPVPSAVAQDDYQPTVLITGANRGMGLEFARQYAARDFQVIATARSPEKANELNKLAASNSNVIVEQLDVTDHDRIDELAEKYRNQPIDIVVNNAGIAASRSLNEFGNIDYELFDLAIAVNTYGPIKIAEAFMPHVTASKQKKIIAVSSNMSSIENAFGGIYIYRVSKTALNMAYHNLSKDVRDDGIIIGLVTPPRTATDLQPPGTDLSKLSSAKDSVAGMIEIIDRFDLQNSGSFYGDKGKEIPW
ncbi:MAG: SDR family oxidoreductase [Pseudomonadota bacterium]